MDIFIIIALIVGGLVFFLIEVFLIPGLSIAGIAAGICLFLANLYAFTHLGVVGGIITLLVSIVGIACALAWFMKSKTVDKLSLKESIDYRPEPLKGIDLKVGDEGLAITRLALIGNAEFNGHVIEVRSADGFIDEKTPIVVHRINEGVVTVKEKAQ